MTNEEPKAQRGQLTCQRSHSFYTFQGPRQRTPGLVCLLTVGFGVMSKCFECLLRTYWMPVVSHKVGKPGPFPLGADDLEGEVGRQQAKNREELC